jgi:hypothetical protein
MYARAGKDAEGATLPLLEERDDLKGLPLRKGAACKLNARAARRLEEGSIALRGMLGGSPFLLWQALADSDRWRTPESIPALLQMLMAEHESVRKVLVRQLAAINGREAAEALAQRALFDLDLDVRARALEALRKRPVEQYLDVLLSGFRHPWPVVAEHAAEAIGSLELNQALPGLQALLSAPDPQAPYRKGTEGLFVKEMVRINHLANCLMCHPPSMKREDKVRGRVPPTNEALPPATSREYYEAPGLFVRADVTYLKQDFSALLPVKNPGHWPALQRFDFFVRERPAARSEQRSWVLADRSKTTEHQQSLMFALRELTGHNPGPSVADWKKYLGRQADPAQKRQ